MSRTRKGYSSRFPSCRLLAGRGRDLQVPFDACYLWLVFLEFLPIQGNPGEATPSKTQHKSGKFVKPDKSGNPRSSRGPCQTGVVVRLVFQLERSTGRLQVLPD